MTADDSLGDYFRDVKTIKQQKRESNRIRGVELLNKHGIAFVAKNDGAHLIVTHNGRTADYWPGTGKFIFRDRGKGRGIFSLLKIFGIEVPRA